MTPILVTGGAGYVGSHTVHHLIASGIAASEIVIFDNLELGGAEFVPPGVALVHGDLRNPAEIAAIFGRYAFASVLHLAAYTRVDESMRSPHRYFHNNITGSLNLLEAARMAGCRR